MICIRTLAVALGAWLWIAPQSSVLADCCAGGRAEFLVYGGRLGRGGGNALGRTARPFTGIPNPRYARTQEIGGPLVGTTASTYVARRSFVNVSQLQSIAAASSRDSQPTFASDAELLDDSPIADEQLERETFRDDRSFEYPGQAASQRRSGYDRSPTANANVRTPASSAAAARGTNNPRHQARSRTSVFAGSQLTTSSVSPIPIAGGVPHFGLSRTATAPTTLGSASHQEIARAFQAATAAQSIQKLSYSGLR